MYKTTSQYTLWSAVRKKSCTSQRHRDHKEKPEPVTCNSQSQTGGITIMVTLSLLILLTIAAISMSKNSFKEIQTSGLMRQGAMARSVADSGIEWSIFWISLNNFSTSTGDQDATKLIELKDFLAENNEQSGRARDIYSRAFYNSQSSNNGIPVAVGNASNFNQSFTIGLTRMGKLPVTNMSQGVSGGYTPAAGSMSLQAPDLWAIRSDAWIKHQQGGLVFTHGREVWVSTPIK